MRYEMVTQDFKLSTTSRSSISEHQFFIYFGSYRYAKASQTRELSVCRGVDIWTPGSSTIWIEGTENMSCVMWWHRSFSWIMYSECRTSKSNFKPWVILIKESITLVNLCSLWYLNFCVTMNTKLRSGDSVVLPALLKRFFGWWRRCFRDLLGLGRFSTPSSHRKRVSLHVSYGKAMSQASSSHCGSMIGSANVRFFSDVTVIWEMLL